MAGSKKPAPAEIRAAWLRQLFSTEPADRPRAEAAASALYAALGLPAPRCLWFDGPCDGAWATVLLSGAGTPWAGLIPGYERDSAMRATMERIRERLCHSLAAPDWQSVLSAVGSELKSSLLGESRIREARLSLYPDAQSLERNSTFTGEDDLDRAESHFCRMQMQDVAGIPGARRLGVVGALAQESAPVGVSLKITNSNLNRYPLSLMAADEAQAAGGASGAMDLAVPPLLAALWEMARCSGPWWAFEHAVIFTDRPAELHLNDRLLLHSADGPAALYRDGWPVYAWEGQAVKEPGPPEQIAMLFPPSPRPLHRAKTPGTTPGPAPYLDRYLAGEHRQVWAELIALGPAVREAPHIEGARLVAQETMRRVAANVRTVVNRLRSEGYRFKNQDMHQRGKPADGHLGANVPPGPQTPEHLHKLDEMAGPVPLSLWAFYEIVGSVDFTGYHDEIAPDSGGHFLPDPLVVSPLEAMLLEYDDQSVSNYGRIVIAPDAYHKADFSGGAPYEMALPDARADGELLNESHGLFFVDYLRLVFRHGGFPGYVAIYPEVPPWAIVMLTRGLQPF